VAFGEYMDKSVAAAFLLTIVNDSFFCAILYMSVNRFVVRIVHKTT